MNEYWQADDYASFCFCFGGQWYQLLETEGTWDLCSVTMDRGLPSEMHENFYHEVDLATTLRETGWNEVHLQGQVSSLRGELDFNRVRDV